MLHKLLLRKQTIAQASVLLMAVSVFSRILGLAREMLVARTLGSSADYDLFLTVFMIPSAITTAISYTVAKAVIPYFQQMKVERGEAQANTYAWSIILYGSVGFLLLGLLFAGLAPLIITWLLPSSTLDVRLMAERMFRVISFFPLLFFWFSSVSSFLRAERYFAHSAVALLLHNLVLIPVIVLFPGPGVWALLWGWLLGLVAQVVWATAAYVRSGHGCVPREIASSQFPRRYWAGILVVTIQIIFVELWGQLWTVSDRYLAQFFSLPAGSISSIMYASTLYAIPLSIFNLGIGSGIFPFLSAHIASGNTQAARAILSRGIRSVAVMLIPLWAFMLFFAHDTVALFYERGAFDAVATATTATALRWLANALPLDGLYVILATQLYAARRYGALLAAAIIPFLIKLAISYLAIPSLGFGGLPMTTFVASVMRILILFTLVDFQIEIKPLLVLVGQMVAISLVAVGLPYLMTHYALTGALAPLAAVHPQVERLARFALATGVAGALMAGASIKLRIPEAMQAIRWLRARLSRRAEQA
jgi:putative peptidoglycan lipid II flippase